MSSSGSVVKPVILYTGKQADKVIHLEPAFKGECGSCLIRHMCETKSKSQRPVIRSGEKMDKAAWEKYLEKSNCGPSLRERDW
jgi:hypothetical protein